LGATGPRSGSFDVTERASSTDLRPLPYTPEFAERFPNVITFVGTLDAVVTNEPVSSFGCSCRIWRTRS